MNYRAAMVVWLVIGGLSLARSGSAASDLPHQSLLEGVTVLDKPVTYTETKIPLGELVAKVAADTGVKLTASAEVADEPVAVVVKEYPARELLEQLADLLDYQWHIQAFRRSGVQAFRTGHIEGEAAHVAPERLNVRTPERSPSFEIYQDLAARQREAALREARRRESERRFQEVVRRDAEVAALPAAQLDAMAKEDQRQEQLFETLSPAQRQAIFRSPKEWERLQRLGAAQQLSTPVRRALAQFLGRLTQEQWALLWREEPVVFSTAPGPGELPLPAEIARLLSAAKPALYPPNTIFPGRDAGAEAGTREERELQDQWAAASGYRILVRLDPGRLEREGTILLNAGAGPILADAPRALPGFEEGTSLMLGAVPMDVGPAAVENTPERQATLAKDPVLGAKKRFQTAVKPRPVSFFPGGMATWQFRDLLPDVAHVYDVQILSDAYSNSAAGSPILSSLPAEPLPLYALLDRLAGPGIRWDHTGKLIRLRSRTWFLDRPREIPMRLIRRWKALYEQNGALPLDEYLRAVTELTDAQLDGFPNLGREMGVPLATRDFLMVDQGRGALRLYASLPPAQRQALQRGVVLTAEAMTPAQRPLFQAALREMNRHHLPPLDLQQWSSGSLSLQLQPGALMPLRSPFGGPGGAAFGPPGGGGAPPPGPAAPPPPSAPAPPPPPGHPALPGEPGAGAAPARQKPLTTMNFALQFGGQEAENVALTVVSP